MAEIEFDTDGPLVWTSGPKSKFLKLIAQLHWIYNQSITFFKFWLVYVGLIWYMVWSIIWVSCTISPLFWSDICLLPVCRDGSICFSCTHFLFVYNWKPKCVYLPPLLLFACSTLDLPICFSNIAFFFLWLISSFWTSVNFCVLSSHLKNNV